MINYRFALASSIEKYSSYRVGFLRFWFTERALLKITLTTLCDNPM